MNLIPSSNIAFASKYAVDKIVGVYVDRVNPATQVIIAGFLYQYSFPHPFGRPVFTELLFSSDNGATYQDGGSGKAISYSDSNNIYITTWLTPPGGGANYPYKVIASWIDDYDNTNPLITPQLNTTNNAYFDSRKNYPKIFDQNVVSAPATVGDHLFTIPHTLGYVPRYKVYGESVSGQVWPATFGGTNNTWNYGSGFSEISSIISATQLKMDVVTGGHATRAWYRIYVDS